MQKINNKIVFSASDITYYAECEHRTWLDRLNLDTPMEKAEDDAQSKLVQTKGFEHEATFFAKLQESHDCVEIDTKQSLEKRIEATRLAIEAGAEVIFQGTLSRGNLIGHSDFLLRLNTKSSTGKWLYEVADTKLAKSTKAKFILQLCFYSDLLSDITGQLPHHMHVELGTGKRVSFKVSDYFYYYKQLLERYLDYVASYPEITPPYPSPCNHCSLCPWRDRCEEKRISDDHLSAVANINRQQILRLEKAGVNTLARLADLSDEETIPKFLVESLNKLRHQAALQLHERNTGKQKVVVLPFSDDKLRGFARLPNPNEGDLFFDMEGNPMHEGGLEYLFGIYYFNNGKPIFTPFWGHDREQERQAFSDFMDFVEARKARFPKMHIYHYANYENAALKRLMGLHGIKESAVNDLLREQRLVDLYTIVREGLRISKPSYSIKALEAFYADKRSGDVKKATDSIVVYEQWCESKEPALLESIRQYNEDDCRSTWQLREWLLSIRPSDLNWYSSSTEKAVEASPTKSKGDKTIKLEAELAIFHQRLVVNPENSNLDLSFAELVDSVLDFYRRANRPVWWSIFERQGTELDLLLDDPETIAGMHSPEDLGNKLYRYTYPEQDFKLRESSRVSRLDNLKQTTLIKVDEQKRIVEFKLNLDKDEIAPENLSLTVGSPISTDVMQNALFRFADSVIKDEGKFKAVMDYLMRNIPDIQSHNPGSVIVGDAENQLDQIISKVSSLNNSYLFIQGPPGTGKTYTGSHLIAELLQQGKTVAVSSNSHKAINNLLHAVDVRMTEAGKSYYGIKKVSKADDEIESAFIQNCYSNVDIIDTSLPQLLAGTAWLLSNSELTTSYDYLFIDEAGQVSLANTIAMGMCARNIILLGDQMQLGQPIQGVHPGRSGESALEYLLDGESTIAPNRGIFLGTTYRMHPDVCRFISDAIYDSKLFSHRSTFKQSLILNSTAHLALKSTGISYLPVEHDGCSQRSEEEATIVRELVMNLLTQSYQDGEGKVHSIKLNEILIVAPYNMQVNLLKSTLPEGARVGTVDKFQGQEAQVVIVSMTTSSEEYLPRFIDFLFSKNRLNVAISRARSNAILVTSKSLPKITCNTIFQMELINLLCRTISVANNINKKVSK